jgi:phage gp16-like protein
MKSRDDNDMRRRELAAIHLAKKTLGMDDETYRQMLHGVTGKSSAADLTGDQRRMVLDYMRRLGAAKKEGHHPGRPRNLDREPLLQKIQAQLADMKLSWAYADSIAKRQCGIDKVSWVRSPDQLRGIVAALTVEQEKRALSEQIDNRLQMLGMDDQQAEAKWKLPAKWRRNRKAMQMLIDHIDNELLNGG